MQKKIINENNKIKSLSNFAYNSNSIVFNFPIGYTPSQSFDHTSTLTCLIATHLAQVAARHLNSIEFEMEVEIEIDCEVVAAVAVVVAI